MVEMVEYTRIAVLLVVVLGRYVEGHHGEGGSGSKKAESFICG